MDNLCPPLSPPYPPTQPCPLPLPPSPNRSQAQASLAAHSLRSNKIGVFDRLERHRRGHETRRCSPPTHQTSPPPGCTNLISSPFSYRPSPILERGTHVPASPSKCVETGVSAAFVAAALDARHLLAPVGSYEGSYSKNESFQIEEEESKVLDRPPLDALLPTQMHPHLFGRTDFSFGEGAFDEGLRRLGATWRARDPFLLA